MADGTSGAGAPQGGAAASTTSGVVGGSGTGAPGASAPGASGAPGVTTGASGNPSTESVNPGAWMAGMNDDMKGYIGLKGFKGPGDLAESYRNLEKLRGVPEDRLLKLPEAFYDEKGAMTAEGRAIYDRLGTPKDAKDYNLEMPKEGGDQALMDAFRKNFHELGLTKKQGEDLVKQWNKYNGDMAAAMKDQAVQRFNDSDKALKKEWGQAFDQNVNIAKEAYRKLGMEAKQVDALSQVLGHKETMQLLHKLGTSVGEHAFVQGNQPRMLEPSSAVTRIAELRSDKVFAAKLAAGDVESMNTWTKLHEMAYPGNFDVRN